MSLVARAPNKARSAGHDVLTALPYLHHLLGFYCSCSHLRHCRLETKLLNNMGGAIHPPAVKEDRLGRRFQRKPHSFYFLIRRCFIGLGGDLSHHVSMSATSTRLAALVTTTYRHVG